MPNPFSDALSKSSRSSRTSGTSTPASTTAKRGKHIGGYFPPEVSRQLRQLALDEEQSIQALMAEALDMLFESRHLPAIARRPSPPA